MLHAILTHSHAILKFSDKYLDQRNMRKTATDHPELTDTVVKDTATSQSFLLDSTQPPDSWYTKKCFFSSPWFHRCTHVLTEQLKQFHSYRSYPAVRVTLIVHNLNVNMYSTDQIKKYNICKWLLIPKKAKRTREPSLPLKAARHFKDRSHEMCHYKHFHPLP